MSIFTADKLERVAALRDVGLSAIICMGFAPAKWLSVLKPTAAAVAWCTNAL